MIESSLPPTRALHPLSPPLAPNPECADLAYTHWKQQLQQQDAVWSKRFGPLIEKKRDLFAAILSASPHMTELLQSCWQILPDILVHGATQTARHIIDATRGCKAGRDAPEASAPPAGRFLRRQRKRMALTVAIADLQGSWSLPTFTKTLSAFADAAFARALRVALGKFLGRELCDAALERCGIVVLALGKLGGKELNYSSDVDLLLFHQPRRLSELGFAPGERNILRLARQFLLLLEEVTVDGRVFRVDLRLRPCATPIVLDIEAALQYYRNLGQNWERAAMIKARFSAGDRDLGAYFLKEMRPFVWRRSLDFYALQDMQNIRRQIDARQRPVGENLSGYNLKLGRGGIRDIEFYVQLQQLIWGGRDSSLQSASTEGALRALCEAGHITQHISGTLHDAYRFLRCSEHRLQMLRDRQTHSIPSASEERRVFAAFAGHRREETFADKLRKVTEDVAEITTLSFREDDSAVSRKNLLGQVSFSGFRQPEQARRIVEHWRCGRYRATRLSRAVEAMGRTLPNLLDAFRASGDADLALRRFDGFLAHLQMSGTQFFCMLEGQPILLNLLAEIMGAAPTLADMLGRHPKLLESVFDSNFLVDFPGKFALQRACRRAFREGRGLEAKLEACQRFVAEQRFRIDVGTLRRIWSPATGLRATSMLSEIVVRRLFTEVYRSFVGQHGLLPGDGLAILSFGKLASYEMQTSSDLDIVFVYDGPTDEVRSDGRKPLWTSSYYIKLSQRLVSALQMPTAQGRLFSVDIRLRPSGISGPLASSIDSFLSYHRKKAWTWEHLALTHSRVIAGKPCLRRKLSSLLRGLLSMARDASALLRDVQEMWHMQAKERTQRGPWDLKNGPGGLVDLEFAAQYLQLRHGANVPLILDPSATAALQKCIRRKCVPPEPARAVILAGGALLATQTLVRITIGESATEDIPTLTAEHLARTLEVADKQSLIEKREELRATILSFTESILGRRTNRGAFTTQKS